MVSNPRRIENQTFVGVTVQIDGGVAYIKCRFINCIVVFTGAGPIQMENTTFENPQWSFAGPAANMLNFLSTLYATGQKELVEQIFQSIRPGVFQTAPNQQNPAPTPATPPSAVQ